MELEPLTPAAGVEIRGLDLCAITDSQFSEVFRALCDYGVLFFRDQKAFSKTEQFLLAERFGEIHVHPSARGRESEFPGMMTMRTSKETEVAAGNRWHSDVSCDAEPPQATILQLHKIPPLGGDTLFSSLYAAYDALSDPMKVYLDGLTALHSGEDSFRRLFRFSAQEGASWPENHHPVVRKHVDSGRPVLFVNREFTQSIDDLPREEGRALLEFLFDHAERVAFQCRFRWSENAVAIWDNRAVMHHAMWDYWPQERLGRRITVRGEKPAAWRLDTDRVNTAGPAIRLSR